MPSRGRSQSTRRGAGSVEAFASKGLIAWLGSQPELCFGMVAVVWVFLLYRHALAGGFVYDDVDQIQRNPGLTEWTTVMRYFLTATHFSTVFRGAGAFYRPLFWASLALDRRLWGLQPAGFHATNLVLHAANGFLSFVLLRRLSLAALPSAAAAIVWLGLPIHAEPVVWISGRAYCLVLFFLLVSLLAAEWYRDSRRGLALLVYGVAAVAALLCHEAGLVLLPLVWLTGAVRNRLRATWVPLGAASLTADGIYFALRQHAGGTAAGSFAILPVGLSFGKYLSWTVLPVQMSMERSTDFPGNQFSAAALGALAGVTVVMCWLVRIRRSRPEAAAGVGWMVITLLPFSGIVILYQGLAERYTYAASLGLAVALAGWTWRAGKNARTVMSAALLIWVLWGAWRLNSRVLDWHDEATLFRTSLEATPNSVILLSNLGQISERSGDFEKAISFYERASSLGPKFAAPVAGLGNIYFARGNLPAAMDAYTKAVELDPRDAAVRTNFGAVLQRTGDLAGAEREDGMAISIDAEQDEAYANLGAVLFQEGKLGPAIEQLQHAVKLNPRNRSAYLNMGSAYRQQGDLRMAANMYLKAEQAASQGAPQDSGRKSYTIRRKVY